MLVSHKPYGRIFFFSLGNVTALMEDENGALLSRQLTVPPSSGGRSDHPSDDVIPGSLQNPFSINFNDRHEYVLGGIRYLGILANSSLVILRDEGDRTAYHFIIPYPDACRATYIQPSYPEGVFCIIFQHPCSPLYVDADYNANDPDFFQDNEQLDGKKVIVLEGLDIYQERNTFPTYVGDTGKLVFQFDGQSNEVTPTSIGSCSVLQDLHPFSTHSASGNLELIVDCLGDNNEKLRYVTFIHYNRSVLRVFQVTPASGTPLSDGNQYITVIHEDRHSISLIDIDGGPSLPPTREYLDVAITKVKFLITENFTKMVVYRVGEDIMFVDVPEFVASNGLRGKEEQQGTTIRSCDPACPPAELMGDQFVMMTVLKPDSFYEIIYRPLDFDSTTELIHVERVASRPVILSFIQTGLEIVPTPTTSPPTDSEITTTPTDGPNTTITSRPGPVESVTTNGDENTTTDPPRPIPDPLILTLAIGIPAVAVAVTACIVLSILLIFLNKRVSRRREKITKSLEKGTPSTLTMSAPKSCLAQSCICPSTWSSVYQQTKGLQETGVMDSTQPNGPPLSVEERSQYHPTSATTTSKSRTEAVLPTIQVGLYHGPETPVQERHILLRPPSQASSDSAYSTSCASTPTLTPDASPRSSIRHKSNNRDTSIRIT